MLPTPGSPLAVHSPCSASVSVSLKHVSPLKAPSASHLRTSCSMNKCSYGLMLVFCSFILKKAN